MAAAFQPTFSNTFSWMKYKDFNSIFTEICPQVSSEKSNVGLDDGLAPIRRQAIIWANDSLVYWRIYMYASLASVS